MNMRLSSLPAAVWRRSVLGAGRLFAVLVAALLVADAHGQATGKQVADAPMKPVVENADLPRVLLIGDSISIGYTVPVRKLLSQEANVIRPLTNCGPTTRGLEGIEQWLGDGKWDVIHFNWGLHDLKYVQAGTGKLAPVEGDRTEQQVLPKDYAANLEKLVQRLKKTGATLIWCSTTPVPPDAKGRVVGDSQKYNALAAEIMQRHGVETNDLYTLAKQRQGEIQRPADVHFTPAGSGVLAEQVAQSIGTALASRASQ